MADKGKRTTQRHLFPTHCLAATPSQTVSQPTPYNKPHSTLPSTLLPSTLCPSISASGSHDLLNMRLYDLHEPCSPYSMKFTIVVRLLRSSIALACFTTAKEPIACPVHPGKDGFLAVAAVAANYCLTIWV
jgi:hypothetical protein